ncbi:MAG: acyl-CoA dehydrogenase [Rhodospirillaceae bacterium]|nr:acyl-CoA dehydrogenase [Rhodospirillaceae bacterium]HAA93340.1 acyl-CoA dehydrogenase [Rhodospirillaceae bacterium]
MDRIHYEPCNLPPEADALRREVREFLTEELAHLSPSDRANSWSEADEEFTKKIGARGWIGLTWPKKYGGQERTMLERYVVQEEFLAAGAPITLHHIADRQSGPLLMRFASEETCLDILPRIAKGECYFCIGMSEPDTGSDLAAVRSKAEKVDGGWLLNGSKIWTSRAHMVHYMIGLFRTDPKAEKHSGLSQFLIDLRNTDGISIRPVINLAGRHDFNQVFFEDVLLPEDALIGEENNGWHQVLTELTFERAGPERYMSSQALMNEVVRSASQSPGERAAVEIGKMVANLASLRQMSLSVASMQQAGEDPAFEGSLIKEIGVNFEQSIPRTAHELFGLEAGLENGSELEKTYAKLNMVAPSFSLRGGTREVLRGIIAKRMGLR